MRVHELFDLGGQNAIVTGGGSGLGRYFAEALADARANVVLCARKAERCRAAATELEGAYGTRVVATACDVRDPDQVVAAVEFAEREIGPTHILVNNAGTSWGAPAETYPLDGWRKVIEVNLTGTFLFAQAVGRGMISRGEGAIVNVASVAALVGAPAGKMDAIAYNASKGGVVSFTRDLAVKWAPHGIRVNAIAPGWFPTEMSQALLERSEPEFLGNIPLGRFGAADDLRGAVLLLASRAGAYITGQTLVVDGGQSIS
ncbi:MAG: SDR family oxidoreductase [Actinobacteria bacterium]|nr:SDR family oxidoreductase [Actinomycetota bacterium]